MRDPVTVLELGVELSLPPACKAGVHPRAGGRVREIFDRKYGRRFLLLGLAAFLTNIFQAPSSQLANRYLHREHSFSNSEVALFRSVTAGVPGVIGVLLGGRLSESRGRRPVTIIGILIASGSQMAFFLSGGVWLWITPTIAIIAALAGGLALGALDTELFPTEVRGTSNGFLLVCGVVGTLCAWLVERTRPTLSASRGIGASFVNDRCVRTSLYN